VTKPSIPAAALLPLRFFIGFTFLWAGLDKLLDPAFFDPTAATSLHAQLVAFARESPLGPLIRASLPFAAPMGLLIALGEIGAGIGALTGLAFRVAAVGGATLSFLFWLTASWATRPYYFGADLPYLLGWITLAIAGHGDLLVPAALRLPTTPKEPRNARERRQARARPAGGTPISPERRLFLQTSLLAGIAAVVASLTGPLQAIGLVTGEPAPSPSPSPSPTPSLAPGTSTPPTTVPGTSPGGLAIAQVADVQQAGSVAFTIPFNAPSPLPAGDPGVIVQLADGSFVAFDAVCTHAGCTVEFDKPDLLLVCPCHSAVFDPTHDAAVLQGPTSIPLTKLPIVIDPVTGTISLVG
jgi:thiosulfate dehydrogenase [quinone] large subunit